MKHGNISIFVPHSGCPNQCSFCNQKTITGHSGVPDAGQVREVVDTALASAYGRTAELEIAFFGGSFTAIPEADMRRLLEAAAPYVKDGSVKGIRVSTRPDCVGTAVLTALKEYGVTAVELGAQSMDDTVLACNGRGHTAGDVALAARRIHKFGFSLGLQMMTGLYGSTQAIDLQTARRIIALKPDTVRIYPTVVLEGTQLAERMRRGEFIPQGTEAAAALCAQLLPLFEAADIPVIRLGLHSSKELDGQYLGGAYHPALRELVENRLYLNNAMGLLAGRPKGAVMLYVAPGCISKMTGQKKRNLILLAQRGYPAKVAEDSGLSIHGRALRIAPVPQGERPKGRVNTWF